MVETAQSPSTHIMNAYISSYEYNQDDEDLDPEYNDISPNDPSSLDQRHPSQLDTQPRKHSQEVQGQGGEAQSRSSSDILPRGMDVRDALAKCEDPALGWSLQFWVTIADPLTNQVFFACPATGTCSWEPPIGAFLLPRQEDGEWWELADSKRGNRSYYYNTMSGSTQWTRPAGNAFVIPLGLIQQAALPPRPARMTTPILRTSTPAHLSPNKRVHLAPPIAPDSPVRQGPRPPPSPRGSSGNGDSPNSSYTYNGQSIGGTPRASSIAIGHGVLGSPLEIVEEGSSRDTSDEKSRLRSQFASTDSEAPPHNDEESYSSKSPTTPPHANHIDGRYPVHETKAPIIVDSIRTKRLSTGLHPLLPTNISSQIQSLQSSNSINQYFATRRTGLRRAKVPIDKIMEWQRSPINAPILVISHNPKDAVATFKIIQHVMGERDRPVELPKPTRSSSATKLALLSGPGPEKGSLDKMIVLEEIRWLIQLSVTNKEMRDEVYCQLVKQLTKNPNTESMVLGFQLFCVLANAFYPSPTFEQLVRTFLQRHTQDNGGAISTMAKYCTAKLEVLITQGSRAKALTIGEIEAASDAAFYPAVYGESLDRIMSLQERSYPELLVPVILPFLADGILALGGTHTEGIFRVPGDNEAVGELKSRMDRGHYQLHGIEDPHVAASLFKLWLRELESPIIPVDQYNTCLSASKSARESINFVRQLPVLNRRVLVFVISFIQIFLEDEVVERTKMTASNLALVLAPNMLRTTSKTLSTVFTNSTFESKFIMNLLDHMDPEDMDPEYIPKHGKVPSWCPSW